MNRRLWQCSLSALLAVLLCVLATGCGQLPSVSSLPESDGVVASASENRADSDSTTAALSTGATTAGGGVKITTSTANSVGKTTKTTVAPSVTTQKTDRTTPTTAPAPAVKGKTKVSDYVPNAGAWAMQGIRSGYGNFTYQVQILGKSQYYRQLLEKTIKDRKLGDTGYSFGASVNTHEWPGLCNYGAWNTTPANRQEALNSVRAYLAQEIAGKTGPYASMDSFTRWQHYTAEAGYDYIGCELGANVNASNLSIAFTRGAAKQYSEKTGLGSVEAWFVDFSLWNWLGMINYSGDETMHRHNDGFHDNIVNHEYAGQSVDDARRAYYMAYMSGAQWLINEGGAESACYTTVDEDDTWLYDLSPHGEMNQEFYAFTQRNPDRGVTYTPFAVVINHDHGLPYGHWRANENNYKVFERFTMTAGDWMISNLFAMLYPDSYPYQSIRTNEGQQVNTPYGDTVDVLTHTAAQSVLNSYPVVILAGDIAFTTAEVSRYMEYVRQGGILVMNSAYKKYFTAFTSSKNYGEGRVIVYGDDYSVKALPPIMDALATELIPFTLDERVQYILNVKDGSLVLTLINNNGVYKAYDSPIQFDESKTLFVNVSYTGSGKVLEVRDWISGKKLTASADQMVELGPGDIAVLEFVV